MIETTEAYGLTFSYPSGDTAIGRCLRDFGEFARVGATLSSQLSSGGAFIDVGANIGAIALPVARRARQVFAIEAHPDLAQLLLRNVEANQLSNVVVINAAAGSRDGNVHFPTPPLTSTMNFGTSGIGRSNAPSTMVPMVTIDSIAPADTLVIKIDVEGYESEVMAGAKNTIANIRPSWIVEANTDTEPSRSIIRSFMESAYKLYWLYDPFVTGKAPKSRWRGRWRGDLSIFAVPSENLQPKGMVEIDLNLGWPPTTAGFTYLRAFGIEVAT